MTAVAALSTLGTRVRSSDTLNILLDIERRYDVELWRINNVGVWPLVRVWLYMDIMNRALMQGSASSSKRLAQLTSRLIRAQVRVGLASWRDREANARLDNPADAVFYSDGVNFVRVDGLWYDKLFDPIISWIVAHGGRHLLLTPMAEAHHPRHSASKFVQPRLDAIKVLAAFGAARFDDVNLPGFELALASHSMDRRRLFALWRRLCSLSEYFQSILRRARPLRAFVNTYYSVEGMAFVLACKHIGVPVADVQHGLQGAYHVAYGQWRRLPIGGYELLPDEFWVWSESEHRAIDDWRPAGCRLHVPVIAGNAWLDLWRTETDPLVARVMQQVRRIRRSDARYCVLITLQWGLHDGETLRLLSAIARLPPDFHCWLRLHPLVAHERRRVREMAESCGLRNVEIDEPTDLPLHALLRTADVHLTHSSSTVIEAGEFGLRSVVCSDYGAQFFAAQIAAGEAVVARSVEEITAAVVALAEHERLPAKHRQSGNSLAHALGDAFPALAS